MEINESVMCANFGDPRPCDRELTQKKPAIFGLKMF